MDANWKRTKRDWQLQINFVCVTISESRNKISSCIIYIYIYIYNIHRSLHLLCIRRVQPKRCKFPNLFISVRRSTCFRRFLRPSSGAQNCTYSVRYLSDQYCYLLLALTFHCLFISVRRSTCFRRFLRPSSGAHNCTYSVRYLSDQYSYLLLSWLRAGSSIGLTNTWRCMCSFELLMMDGKPVWNM